MSKWYSFEELKRARTPMLLDSVTGLPDNHVITVVERVISVDNSELIQNNVRTDTVTLDLDAEYDDLNVIIIFTKPNNINVQVAYNGQPVHIPGSVMELTGSVAVSVVGLDSEGETRAVTKAAPDTFQVVASGAYTGRISQDDVDLLGQILQAVSDTETAITAAETAITAAETATTAATSAATSATSAASSANSAASSASSAATKANSAAVDAQNAYDTLQPYMATIDSCANILHREVGPDTVVTADDSFPAKPVEMTVYGNTRQNLWVNPNGTRNGITVTSNADGSFSVSGTAPADASNSAIVNVQSYVLKPSTQYTLSCDKAITFDTMYGFFVNECRSDGAIIFGHYLMTDNKNTEITFTTSANIAYCRFGVSVAANATASGTYRVMLNEGSEAQPWCPPGLNSVGEGGSVDIVTAGKNLLPAIEPGVAEGITLTGDGNSGYSLNGTATSNAFFSVQLPSTIRKGTTLTLSANNQTTDANVRVAVREVMTGPSIMDAICDEQNASHSKPLDVDINWCIIRVASGAVLSNFTVKPQLELGSTATDYEPPNITTTSINLQGHTLNALPDGTRDELHIDGGGNVVLEKRTQKVTFESDGWSIRSDSGDFVYGDAYNSTALSPTAIPNSPYDNILCDKYRVTNVSNNKMPLNAIRKLHSGGNMICVVQDGTQPVDDVTVVYQLAEPQTIDLGTITPPTMAAPNVTAYVADDTPAEMKLDYVRDINIVVDRLEKKVADLVVTEATHV